MTLTRYIVIDKKDDVYLKIEADDNIRRELGEYFTFEEDSNDITVLKAPNGQLTMRNASVSSFSQGDGTGDAYSSSYTQGNLTGFNI